MIKDNKILKNLSGIIQDQHLAWFKGNKDEQGIKGNNFGVEGSDNAFDQDSMNFEMTINEYWPDTNKPKTIKLKNDGENLTPTIMGNEFIKMPTKSNKYSIKSIGCRGFGGKAEWTRAGMPKVVKTKGYRMDFTPCSDADGKYPVDFDGLSHYNEDAYESVSWVITEDDTISKGVETTIHVNKDCPLVFNLTSIHKYMSKRYSQLNNFNVVARDEVKNTTFKSKKVVFRSLDKNGNLMSDISSLPKYPTKIKVDSPIGEIEFTIYYNWRISSTNDKLKYEDWQEKSKDCYEFKIPNIKDASQPTLNVLNQNNILIQSTGRGKGFWANWNPGQHGQLEIFVKPNKSLNPLLARVKSVGISVDSFRNDLAEKVGEIIRADKKTFTGPYHNVSQKQEDNTVDQWLDLITNKQKGKMQRLALNTISEHLTPKLTSNKDSWIVRRDLECREIDVRFKENILQEWQEGTSDTGHLDGIESRLNLICRDTDTYKQLWWIAEKHTLRDDLVKLMKGFDWKENTTFEKVYLITKDQMFDGWEDDDELSVINLQEDVLV